MIRFTGLVKEVFYTFIVYQVFISIGIGRSYVVFLFHQLDLPNSQIIINDEQKSRIASSIGILSPLGCIFSGVLMDFCGRRLFFFVTFISQIISWVMIALARNYDMLLNGMIIQGINLGMGYIGSIYIPEIVLPSRRRAFLAILSISFNLGVTICNTLMYFVPWNIAAWIYATYSLICMFSMLLLSESPVWLYTKGEKETAIQTLCSLRCSNVDTIQHEIDDLEKSSHLKSKTSTFTGLLKNILGAWKPSLIAISLQALFQMTGYMMLFGYTIAFFDQLRVPIDSSKFAVTYSMAGIIGSVCAPFFMQNMNRRTQMFSCAFVMAICIIVVGIYEGIFYNRSDKMYPYIVSLALYVYALVGNAGVLPIVNSIGAEIYPSEVRGIMNGIFGMAWYISLSVILKLYPTLMNILDIRIILWYSAGFCVAIVLFGIFILPETKGKTLNQVQQQYFQKNRKNFKNENAEL
ncbi:facilitated trehalose transporter Tret1-like [Planococcus citri]|uniref:facilitated trehalose transporter Tret1-like n=1 Tax=Planococcus citri TaxID=170843 RepID=UPI0031F7C035